MAPGAEAAGRRYDDLDHAAYSDWHDRMDPGGYRRVEERPGKWVWECVTPSGLMGTLRKHKVVEHENGTITVSPSILVDAPAEGSWHGYLERGAWREV